MTTFAAALRDTARRERFAHSTRQVRLAFLLLLPTFVVLALVAVYPLLRTFSASLTDEQFAQPGQTVNYIGLSNYQKLLSVQFIELPADKRPAQVLPTGYYLFSRFQFGEKTILVAAADPDFIHSLLNTIAFAMLSVGAEMILGLGLAMLVNVHFRGQGMMRAIMLIPWVIPTVVSAQLWKWILFDNRAGLLNDVLFRFGLITQSYAWRADPRLQIISIALVDIWKTTPYVALILLAGLQMIPRDLYEAAAVDGATVWERFTNITLPSLRPIILLALIFRTLDALRAFDIFAVLLGHDVLSLATYDQEKLINDHTYGYAAAVGVVIFILIFVFTVLYMTVFHVDQEVRE
ncbi:MAG TPA: sugar ABC transporter permease [Aggregatilineales bacterium]|nr:sugar ABC transporter permease [Aggregatilineales bacterium]